LTPTEQIPVSFSEMSLGVVTRQKGKLIPGVVTRPNVRPGGKLVGPGGLIINPPPILPVRKTDEIDRLMSPNDAGLQSVGGAG